ncbi:elongation of very long chain fatty acids protein 7 [Dermacentor silvarum]|uniref:elongation of very long chain fatty acids protein 7 n=1 Tax=Dermacentor silvarum TaxID=543639 RepID=UPI002100F23C|nr:elongation of very long chain fatty acids protein 7 [Dermacentor silvarum]
MKDETVAGGSFEKGDLTEAVQALTREGNEHTGMTSTAMLSASLSRHYEGNSWIPERDHRTEGWFLVGSPVGMLIISAAYLYFVKVAGPWCMARRKPLALTHFLLVYNVAAAMLSAFFGCRFIKLGYWDCGYHILQDVDLSQRRCSLEILRLSWWFLVFRVFEMSDTVLFVLRKKTDQVSVYIADLGLLLSAEKYHQKCLRSAQLIVSGLHVFHHLIIPWGMWLNMNYALQPISMFGTCLNCFVHVVMYTYYFLAALGARYRKFLWWKKHLTTLQMAQFIANIAFCLCMLCSTGDYAKLFVSIGTVQCIIFFAWFLSFYIKVYKKYCACRL